MQERNRLGGHRGPGTVLDTCELFALERVRELLRDNLQVRIDPAPKKSPATRPKGTRAGS